MPPVGFDRQFEGASRPPTCHANTQAGGTGSLAFAAKLHETRKQAAINLAQTRGKEGSALKASGQLGKNQAGGSMGSGSWPCKDKLSLNFMTV